MSAAITASEALFGDRALQTGRSYGAESKIRVPLLRAGFRNELLTTHSRGFLQKNASIRCIICDTLLQTRETLAIFSQKCDPLTKEAGFYVLAGAKGR